MYPSCVPKNSGDPTCCPEDKDIELFMVKRAKARYLSFGAAVLFAGIGMWVPIMAW
jgi:hypothetical protein